MVFDPLFVGIFEYAGFIVPLKIGSIAIVAMVFFAMGFIGNIYAEITKSIFVPVLISMTLVPWFLLSILPIF